MATSRTDFLRIVSQTADRLDIGECAVIAAFVSRVERKASASTDLAETAHLDQVAAAMAAEIGPAMERDIRRPVRRRGRGR